ncbi:MAG: TraR/DksA family transcriptional regulator [Acidimicrobiales bacterium]
MENDFPAANAVPADADRWAYDDDERIVIVGAVSDDDAVGDDLPPVDPFAEDEAVFAAEAAVDADAAVDTTAVDDDRTAGIDGFDVGILDRIEEELADVERALERLGDGSYGRCENCGAMCGEEELEADPTGRFCRAHLPLGTA